MASLSTPTPVPMTPNDPQSRPEPENDTTTLIKALKQHFEARGMPFIDVPIPHDIFLKRMHWTSRHASGAEHQTREFFDQGASEQSHQRALAAKFGLWRNDGCPFGPCVFAAGATVRLIPKSKPQHIHCGVLLDRNHVRGSVFKIQTRDGRTLVASTGQHLIGDFHMRLHLDTLLHLPMQYAQKTFDRYRIQALDIDNIHANLEAFSQELGLKDVKGVPALVHLYNEHTMHNTAGELLAAALTSQHQLVFISNKLAARFALNLSILTSWGGKPEVVTVGLRKARIESIYETVRREGIEETGIDIAPFVDAFPDINYHLIPIGHGEDTVFTPAPCNIEPVMVEFTKK